MGGGRGGAFSRYSGEWWVKESGARGGARGGASVVDEAGTDGGPALYQQVGWGGGGGRGAGGDAARLAEGDFGLAAPEGVLLL
jgi:hypothetical protein